MFTGWLKSYLLFKIIMIYFLTEILQMNYEYFKIGSYFSISL